MIKKTILIVMVLGLLANCQQPTSGLNPTVGDITGTWFLHGQLVHSECDHNYPTSETDFRENLSFPYGRTPVIFDASEDNIRITSQNGQKTEYLVQGSRWLHSEVVNAAPGTLTLESRWTISGHSQNKLISLFELQLNLKQDKDKGSKKICSAIFHVKGARQ